MQETHYSISKTLYVMLGFSLVISILITYVPYSKHVWIVFPIAMFMADILAKAIVYMVFPLVALDLTKLITLITKKSVTNSINSGL